MSGLEGTESHVWDAAQQDATFTALCGAHQKELSCAALSVGSESRTDELRRFLSNARIDGKQGSKALTSRFKLTTPDLNACSQLTNYALDPQSRYLARFSTLY